MKTKKLFVVLFTFMILFSFRSFSSEAADIITRVPHGDTIYWQIDTEGVLTFSGKGAIKRIANGQERPWCRYEIKEIIVEEGITEIGAGVFQECYELETVSLPDGITTIDRYAFMSCTNLKKINLPDSVEFIYEGAFYGCNMLSEITFPDVLFTIRDDAFGYCTSLKTVTFPSSLKSLGVSSFSGCAELKTIYFEGNAPIIAEDTFSRVTATVYYPANDSTWTAQKRQDYSGSLTWKKHTPLTIKTQPKTAYAQFGKTVKTSVTATGDDLTYQWYIKSASGKKYSLSSIKSNTYSCKMTEKSNGRSAYCIITDKTGKQIQTKTVVLRMSASVQTQPSDVYVKENTLAKTSFSVLGDGVTYQWYFKNSGQTKFSKSSITKATYSCKMTTSRDERQIYCVAKDKYGKTVTSNIITLNIKEPLVITVQPKSASSKQNAIIKTTVKASGDSLSYQWYICTAKGKTFSKSSITKATYSCKMTEKSNGRKAYCVITDQYGNTVKTQTVTLHMK